MNTAPELLNDKEAAKLLGIGETRFLEMQKAEGFPAPVWLGPRGKRHVRSELMAWALQMRTKPEEPQHSRPASPPPVEDWVRGRVVHKSKA